MQAARSARLQVGAGCGAGALPQGAAPTGGLGMQRSRSFQPGRPDISLMRQLPKGGLGTQRSGSFPCPA
ncbi:hypothetical protein J6TS7_40720 [Paenibacillus dendritiformis]|nr:hypothetical protein J6TS7_40720 [Paenibacillus dendritiformis]